MSTQTIDRTQETLQTGSPPLAHIVAPKGGVDGVVLCMEARISGSSVQALCGHVFTPSRDPKAANDCETCVSLFERRFPDGEPSDA